MKESTSPDYFSSSPSHCYATFLSLCVMTLNQAGSHCPQSWPVAALIGLYTNDALWTNLQLPARQAGGRWILPDQTDFTHRRVTRPFSLANGKDSGNLCSTCEEKKIKNYINNLRCNVLKAIYLIFLVHLQFKFVVFFLRKRCVFWNI